jgi:plasmid stability protein
MGASCTHGLGMIQTMGKVVHVRDVPDEVHEKLSGLAGEHGLSLSAFMRKEMEHMARRAEVAQRNTEIIKAAREKILSRVPTEEIVAAVHEGRE